MWQQWVNGILGILIVILAYLGLEAATLRTWLTIIGIVIAILGFWGAMKSDRV